MSGSSPGEKRGFRAWFRELFERLKNDPAAVDTVQGGKRVLVDKIRLIKAEADKAEAQAEETRAHATLMISEARAKDAETLARLIDASDKLSARGQAAWISMDAGQAQLHVGERGPGPPWVPLFSLPAAMESEIDPGSTSSSQTGS